VKGLTGKLYWEANVAATWGQMSTGGGHSRLEESMAVNDKKAVMAAVKAADEEENHHHEIVDGGWSKRAHKQPYNAR